MVCFYNIQNNNQIEKSLIQFYDWNQKLWYSRNIKKNLIFSGENRGDGAIKVIEQLIHPLPQASNLILTRERFDYQIPYNIHSFIEYKQIIHLFTRKQI